jgi:hypothetical protein
MSERFDPNDITPLLRMLGFSQSADGNRYNALLCQQAAELIESQKRKIDELQGEINTLWKGVPL